MRSRTVASLGAALVTLAPLTLTLPAVAAPSPAAAKVTANAAPRALAAEPRRVVLSSWDAGAELRTGTARGLTYKHGAFWLTAPTAVVGGYERGAWVSPWVTPRFPLTELVPSWTGATPGDSWVRVQVRGRAADGTPSSWDTISDWALDDDGLRRTSGASQPDDLGRVAYDTWLARDVTSFQVRVRLFRRAGTAVVPRIRSVAAMVSRLPAVTGVATSAPGAKGGRALGTVLDVATYSQMVHRGTYPEYGGGGEAWCSPTSTAMVLGYYGRLPAPADYAWVTRGPDRFVPHVARMTYDTSFDGTGNWPFNTAYAGSLTRKAFVTRLRSLREAERFVAAGIPLVASVTFGRGELAGAPISATNGHLLVIVGFTRDGDVVVNDPAAASDASVRRIYDRGQFEDAWLKRYRSGTSMRGSGGLVYVIHDADHPLPDPGAKRNW